MRFVRHLVSSILLLATSAALAAPPTEGRWALRASARPILLLELHKDSAAKGGWAGSLARPKHFQGSSNFTIFSMVEGPAVKEIVIEAISRSDELELTIRDSSSELTHVIWRPLDDGGGTLEYKDFHFPPISLTAAAADERVGDEWDKSRTYTALPEWPDNSEMGRIFDADQAARSDPASVDWAKIAPQDEARRTHTKALLDAGKLRSGTDFYRAAIVFQHGATPGDYLVAHTLAVIAAARGRPDATWIASATLDRYLQAIGRKQIYGTQFRTPQGQPVSQEPYDRALVSDALRVALGVPGLAAQEEQRKDYSLAPAKP